MYNGARLILPCLLIPLGQERKKGEKERIPPYSECLRDLVSVLGDQEEEGSKARSKKLSRANHCLAPLEFLQVFLGEKVSILNSSLSMIIISC